MRTSLIHLKIFFCCYPHTHIQGSSCPYRHEPAALGHEQVCANWQLGQCFEATCPNRHMVIEKERNQIQCYWENKPTGCRKPHCVFKHTKPQNHTDVIDSENSVSLSSPSPPPPQPSHVDNNNTLVAPTVASGKSLTAHVFFFSRFRSFCCR